MIDEQPKGCTHRF